MMELHEHIQYFLKKNKFNMNTWTGTFFFIGASLIYILLKYIKIGAYMHTIFFPLPNSTPTLSLLPIFDLVVDINLFVNVCHIL